MNNSPFAPGMSQATLVSCITNTLNKIMSIFDADLAWMEQGDTEVSSVPAKTKAAQKET